MRLCSFLIEKYGNIEQAALTFDPAPGRLNLLVAPNGAGKSVLRRAFHDLLFGIPLQSDMKFRFDYPGMHLRANALSAEGAAFTFGWQRKAGRIFPNAAGDPAASRWLAELLAAVTPRQVEMLFALDTARLRSGGEELAAGEGTLASALLSGTGELAAARTLRRSLDERRNGVWERGKSSRPLNSALSRLTAAAKARRDAVQTPRSLELLQAALDETRGRKEAAAADAAAAQAELGRLNRIELTRVPLATLAAAEAWLADHRDVPSLPPGLADELAQARRDVSLAAGRLQETRLALAEAEQRTASCSRDPAAEALAPELAKLPGALGDASTKRRDSAAREGERAEAFAELALALRDIGSAIPPEHAGSVIPTVPALEAAREQIGAHTAAATTLALALKQRDDAEAVLARLEAEAAGALAAAPPGLDLLLGEIRANREPLAHAAELAAATREAVAAQRACLARIPGWSGDENALIALTPGTEASYERLDKELVAAAARLAAAEAERDRLQVQRTQWQTALSALRRQPLPDADTLAAARAQRDRGWQLIYARAFGAGPDAAGERDYSGGEPLPLVFERHLRAADAVADARIEELARVEQAARLSADLAAAEPAWLAAQDAVTQAARARAAAAARWAAACAPLRLSPDATLREVLALLAAREDAIESRRAAEMARDAEAVLTACHNDWASRLAAVLGLPAAPLTALLPRADAISRAATDAAREAVARQTRRLDAERAVRGAIAAVTAAEDALGHWLTGWEAALLSLGRPAGETPAVTERVLARLAELDRHHRVAVSLQARLSDMQHDIAAFGQTVAGLAERLGMPAASDAFTAAEALIARWQRARDLASTADEAGRARDIAATRAHEAAAQHREAAANLTAVLAACGADTPELAEQRIAASRERHRQEELRDTAGTRLRDIAGGIPRDTLLAELAALPPERYEADRDAADAALTRARQAEQEAAIGLAELERQFVADAAATGASEAAESEAAIAAEAGRLLDEYLLLRTASTMLGRALERVEENAGPTGIQRIAAAFEAVTHGAWTVRAGENARGETLLLAQERGSTDRPKQIHELSEGTRDQLYLALRLVAIEAHVAAAPPLPFIADDVLQTFDDARARAAMEALVGLSQHVQVIVLTHHPHLLAVARGLPVHEQRL